MTKNCNRLRGERPKAFWGALVGGAMNLIGSAISSKSQARAIRRQIEAQKEAARTQLELANNSNLASTLNSYATATRSYNDEDDYNLKYRLGGNKRLGSNRIYITDGGNATKIGNDTYLLRGGSHEQTNETGQTGIGINVGGNEVEAEGGEVAQKKNGALRIFSAQPILSNGMSPAQAILRGYNKDKVFSQQQAFKKRNGLKDDGSKAAFGNLITVPFAGIAKNVVDYFSGTGKYAPKRVKVSNKTVNRKPIRNGQVGNFRVANGKYIPNEKPLRRVYPEFDIISMGRGLPVGKAVKATAKAAKNEVSYINRISKSRLYSDNPIVNTYATYARRYNLPDKARVPYMIRRVKSDELPSINNGRITMSGGRFKHTNFTYDRPVVSHRKGKWDTAQQTYLINGRKLVSENKGNWGSIEPSDMFTIQDPKGGLTVPTKDVILVSGHKGLLGQAKASGIKIATSPQLQRIEKSITPRQSLGRFNLAGGERRHYNTPYWIDVNNIVKEYGTPKVKDVRLLEEMTGLKSGVSKLNNNAIKIINDAKGFDKLSLNEAEQVMNQTYPNGRGVNFANDRETYVTSQLPYNNLFYDPTTYAESNYVFPKRFGGRCKLRNGGLTFKDKGSSKHPYPSVSSKDFAGGGRSYPIPTKADAVDALRLAGLHGRSDVRSKVYNKYPSLRKKSLLGSSNRPVKGMRPKAAIGIYTPFNKRYTSIYDAPDYDSDYNGGNVLGNGEVTVTAKRIKPTFMKPNNDAMNIIKVPKEEVPYIPQHHNRSRTIFSGGDYLGLGIDTLSALGTGLITSNAYKNLDFNYNLPNFVEESPVALNTTYHNEAQKSNVERNRLNSRNSILRNTMSGSTAVGRMQGVDTNALYQLNQLADTKENKETELMNQNLLNEQQVRARNAAARNQYYNTVASIKNAALEDKNNASLARSQAFSTSLSGLSQAWNNFWTAGRTAYEDDQARRATIASSKDATPTKLIEMGYDLSPQIIAALYSTSTDQRTKDFYLSMLDNKQRRKYGIS